MKLLKYYEKYNIKSNDEIFNHLIDTLKPSIKVWDFFVNWDKVNSNVNELNVNLNLLNSLVGSENLKEDFINLAKKYPEIIKVLPILLALRENELKIVRDYESKDLSYLEYDFTKQNYTDEEIEKFYSYVINSKLIQLFENKKIKNFVDYVYGVEVGLDSNGRKNRGGKLMEDIVEVFIKDLVSKNPDLEFTNQGSASYIKKNWNINIDYEKSERRFDFVIYNKRLKKVYIFETNFYNGGGSKLKSVCGEFKSLQNELRKQNIDFIWITDGIGWNTTKRPLRETFDNNDYVFNLKMLNDNVLDEILLN